MSISEIQLYQALRLKLGDKEAEELVSFVKAEVKSELEAKTSQFASKQDIADVRREIAEVKADIIKWMFLFWIGQLGAMIGLIVLFLKK